MKAWLGAGLVCLALVAPAPVLAQDVIASSPVRLAATIYRNPDREGGAIDLDDLGGFAVITETRRVSIPAGRHRLRFEGVMAGIIPESVIISGLPDGIIEKNQDADLLSPAALLRATQGKAITLTRTDPATGTRISSPARLVSAGPDGVVFAGKDGFETLRCSGYPETFRYSTGLSGLPGKPTLSVETRSRSAVEGTVTLTYLAENFDWAASYTLHFNQDRKTFDLAGWITLANGNAGSLPEADLNIVAGRLNREEFVRFVDDRPDPVAKCWPMQKTSDPALPGPPYQLVQPYLHRQKDDADYFDEIVVTAHRRREVLQNLPVAISAFDSRSLEAEQLGDLKLYAVPWRTTLAANQMKQVRLMERRGLTGEPVYRARINPTTENGDAQWTGASLYLRSRNDKAHGLGLPLPAGWVIREQDQFGRTMVLNESEVRDSTLNEKIEVEIGRSDDVNFRFTTQKVSQRGDRVVLNQAVEVTNALPHAIAFEVQPRQTGGTIETSDVPRVAEDDGLIWRFQVPANGRFSLTFRALSD